MPTMLPGSLMPARKTAVSPAARQPRMMRSARMMFMLCVCLLTAL
ncbi:hypothetical protein T556_09010 [Neisseria gonorrhoeae NG-k51.05]|nr:hypothetical protein T556_09010 [Neisseria gonorrhoeae NG-k51.05]